MICPRCQATLADGARFCGACGVAFAPTETMAEDPAPVPAAGLGAQIGRTIAGRYRIVAMLGEGGMGAVFRAEQLSLKRAVALKVLRPELSRDAALLRRFNAEAELVAKLSHPNTVNIYDFGQDTDGALFIAMELIEGVSLRRVLRESGPLPPARALAIAAQLAASLTDAHARGIIHRDLKPDNVMLQERGRERDVVRLLDFGIAKLRDDARATQQMMTQAGDLLGTPQYMAPEQIRGEAVDGRTDVYALGCILYEMLTGRMPFEATTVMGLLSKHLLEAPVPPSVRRPDLALSPALDELVLAAMSKPVAARPASMEAYGERIGALLRATTPTVAGGPATAVHAPQVVRPPMLPVIPPYTPGPPVGYAAPTPPPRGHGGVPMVPILVAVGSVLAIVGITVGLAMHRMHRTSGPIPVPAADDPWGDRPSGPSAMPSMPVVSAELPTALVPLPPTAELHPAFQAVPRADTPGGLHWVDSVHGADYWLFPLIPGTNNPDELAHDWLAKNPGLKITSAHGVMTRSGVVPGFTFAGTRAGPGGKTIPVTQLAALYITADYRAGVIVQVPTAVLSDVPFKKSLDELFYSGVDL